MKFLLQILLPACVLMLTGCGYRALSPWMDDESVLDDDQLLGVWQGDCLVYSEDDLDGGDLVLVSACSNPENACARRGYYNLTWFNDDDLRRTELSVLGPIPKRLGATLHEFGGMFLLQLRGDLPMTEVSFPLAAPLFMVYRLEYAGDELRLYEMQIAEEPEPILQQAGLLFTEIDDGVSTVFSKTEDLQAFLEAHCHDPGFFSEEPVVILHRIRDLRPEELTPTEE